MKRIIFLFATALFFLNIPSSAHAQVGPQKMPISCSAPKPSAQRNLERPRGDSNMWVFRIDPAPTVRWVEGPHWSYPGKGGADPTWGQWGGGDGELWLSWISPNKMGAFNIKVTGKITCGGGGGGGPIDIEANWFGDVFAKVWEAGSPIEGGELAVKDEMTVTAGATVWLGVRPAYDLDRWVIQKGGTSEEGEELDDITYTWSHNGGESSSANTLGAIWWTAPETAGDYTVQCVISDGGEVVPPDTGTRDDPDITHTIRVHVVPAESGHWEHKGWNLNGAQVNWAHKTVDGQLYPTIQPTHATEILQWVDPVGGTTEPDKEVEAEFDNIEFTAEFDETQCAFIARATFIAHSTVGGPDSPEVSGSTPLTSGEMATSTQINLSCPPGVLDMLSMGLSPQISLSGEVALIGQSTPGFSCGSGTSAGGMGLMGAGGPSVDIPATTWTTGYDSYLTIDGDIVTLHNPDGTTKTYIWNGNEYESPAGDYTVLTQTGANTYVITEQDGSSQTFDIPGGSSYSNPMLSQTQDRFGNTTTFDRNADGKLTKITDPTGQETAFTYDSHGRLTGITDPYGDTGTISYDANGNLSSVTGTDGRTTSYGYDANGAVNSITTDAGTWTFEREIGDGTGELGFDRRITITDPNGGKTEYYYDAANKRTYRVDPENYTEDNSKENVPKTYYNIGEDPNGKATISGNRDSSGNASYIEYDPVTGLPSKVTDALGNESTYTYNAQGQVTSVTDAAGKTTTYIYDSNGIDLVEIKDADDNTVATFTYGSNHEVLTATDADSNTTTYTYTSWGDVATSTDANGKTTTYHYDSTSRLLTGAEVDGNTVATYTYDSHQRIKTATGADGITQTFDYDDADRVTKITYPDDTYETFSYEACCGTDTNQITEYTDREGRKSTFTYDNNGNRTSVTDSNNNTVRYAYDANNQLQTLIDANNNATAWAYDALGRAIRKTYANGSYEQYTYDAIGQITRQRMPNGTVVQFTYDNRGNVTLIEYPNMANVSYTYNNLGQVATMTDGIGTTTYGYDTMGRLISVDGPWANDTITYSYDALGRRSAIGLDGNTTYYDYDSLDRLSAVTNGSNVFGYSYNGASDQLNAVTLPNGTESTFSYDSLGRLSNVQDKVTSSNANISQFTYGYDNRDVQTSVQRALGTASAQTINYSYDNIDQLIGEVSAEPTPLVNNSYSYDAAGNRTASSAGSTESTFTLDEMNQISGYTLGGNAMDVDYDDNGNTIQIGNQFMTYDDADRLTNVVQVNPATQESVIKTEYVYDGLGRRSIARTYSWDAGNSSWIQQSERRFIYDGMDLIQERDGNNNVIASYVRDGNIGGALSRTTSSGTFYYHYDGNGNVVAMTNSSGTIVAEYTYDAYGNLTAMSGSEAADNPIRFSTKYFDGDTGYYDFGFRSYDPVTGRWLNRDPIGEEGGLNLYGFVGNSPGNIFDGYGLAEDPLPRSGQIRIALTAFIHNRAVWGFRGDGRGFNGNGGTFRLSQWVSIDPKTGSWMTGSAPGLTEKLDCNGNVVASGYANFNPIANVRYLGNGIWRVHMSGRGADPLIPGAPPAAYSFTMNVSANDLKLFDYSRHTEFPDFELWKYGDGKKPALKYGYRPGQIANSPANLINGRIRVDTLRRR